jgi:hypothetical protein
MTLDNGARTLFGRELSLWHKCEMSRRSLYRRYRGISGHIADNPFG